MATKKILLGVLASAFVGAALGILLAPDKGTETRKKIKKKGTDLSSDINGKVNDFVAEMTDKFDSMKKEVNSVRENRIPVSEEPIKNA